MAGQPAPASPQSEIPPYATPTERMAWKLKTDNRRTVYARRKAIVEPVFGQIHTRHGKHVQLRGPPEQRTAGATARLRRPDSEPSTTQHDPVIASTGTSGPAVKGPRVVFP